MAGILILAFWVQMRAACATSWPARSRVVSIGSWRQTLAPMLATSTDPGQLQACGATRRCATCRTWPTCVVRDARGEVLAAARRGALRGRGHGGARRRRSRPVDRRLTVGNDQQRGGDHGAHPLVGHARAARPSAVGTVQVALHAESLSGVAVREHHVLRGC